MRGRGAAEGQRGRGSEGPRTERSSGPGRRSGSFDLSALYAYKLNWQTVLFRGFGDVRAPTGEASFEESERQLFLKVSYALQR